MATSVKILQSLNTQKPHPRTSSRYITYPTQEFTTEFKRLGWCTHNLNEVNIRKKIHKGFQRHLASYVPIADTYTARIGVLLSHTSEIVLLNSHDGLNSTQLRGAVRIHGLYASPSTTPLMMLPAKVFEPLVLLHKGAKADIQEVVGTAIQRTAEATKAVQATLRKLKAANLHLDAGHYTMKTTTEKAIAERWKYFPQNFSVKEWYDFVYLPWRDQDAGVVPSNGLEFLLALHHHLTEGGVKVLTRNNTRNATTRPLRNIKEYVRVSETIWSLVTEAVL